MARINTLHIENFRAIGELDYNPHQINLITGQNNTGKSALLDAVYINATGEVISPSIYSANETYNIKNQETQAVINSDINHVTIYKSLEDCRKADPGSYAKVRGYISEVFSDTIEGDEEYKDQYLAIIFDTTDFVITISDDSFGITPYFPDGKGELLKKLKKLNQMSGEYADASGNFRPGTSGGMRLFPPAIPIWGHYMSSTTFERITLPVNKLSHSDKFQLERIGDKEIHLLEKFIKEHNLVKNIERLTQKNVLYRKDCEIEEIPISAHGDGFVALLTILHNLLQSENGILIIEEPENHLHPRYLSLLIETLFTYCKQLQVQVFMATHSYDLIQGALEYPETEEEKGMLLVSKMTSDGETIEKFDYTTDEGLKVVNELYLDLRGI
ncbi:MAG: AAA family ATPase [Euryarchaeota archaeon]|nr:AAA family ATPase [Euryarchaeota archaeon]